MEAHEPILGPLEGAGGLFPFNKIREGQRQFLEDARSCMMNKVNLVAHAPTGMGKTAVALAAALESTLQDEGLVIFMTSRQSQHNVAVETARHIWRKYRIGVVDLISREDSCLCRRKGEGPPCIGSDDCYFLDKGRIESAAERLLDYPLHVTEAQRMCLRLGACPWRAAMLAAVKADVVVCDYNHLFAPAEAMLTDKVGREMEKCVLIVDEAHNLPGRIIEGCSITLSRTTMQSASRSAGDLSVRSAMQAMLHFFDSVCFEAPREIAAEELESIISAEYGMTCQELAGHIDSLIRRKGRRLLEKVSGFLKGWNANGSSSFRYADPSTGEVHCRFMEPWLIAAPVFERARSSIIMSGTLHPPEMFADLLGIGEMCASRRYRSPFDPGNRNLMAIRDVTSRYDRRGEEMYAKMALKLREISENAPGNMAAFFPSYDMLSSVEGHLKKMDGEVRLLTERRDMARSEKDAMLISLRQDGKAMLLATISGSFGEGVDFPNNLISAVAIVGLPLPPPNIESEEMVRRLSSRYGQSKALMYVRTYPAVIKVLQAAGRAIRSETDRASIVLMDERYPAMNIRTAFPEDFRYVVSTDLGADLTAFHEAVIEQEQGIVAEEVPEKGY